ncbi:MAG: bifunctional 23S rRNA (guanine(2069)-N(7))-methyltransferase RlmK/23S rRNA (guanine(2445)-N(2))-methyltransferase RlmL [Chromatocurvus sp.]
MNADTVREFLALCPRGVGSLLTHELATLGATGVRETPAGVFFSGSRATLYRACLWSRLANRILLPLADFDATDPDALYQGLREIPWPELFSAQRSFAVDFHGQTPAIRNTQFGAQRSKDAIVDRFRDDGHQRPNVDRRQAHIRISVQLFKGLARVALDLCGGSLHQRGYRVRAGEAPLKENLAAALLLRADWPGMAARGGALVDPMCGSATFLIEGALMAADCAPALSRQRFAFEAWLSHDARQWEAVLGDARARAAGGLERDLPEIRGYDADPAVVRYAQANIAAAGLQRHVRVSCKPLAELRRPSHRPMGQGLVICNPPYGERLGEKAALRHLYQRLGQVLHDEFDGWDAAVFTADMELGRAIGLRSQRQYAFYNGALKSSLLLFALRDNRLRDAPLQPEAQSASQGEAPVDKALSQNESALSEGAVMFANRLRKNRRHLASWVKRNGIECYRVYDADMPEYAVAVDIYADWVHIAEYAAPAGVDPEAARVRLEDVLQAVPGALDIAPSRIVLKQRQRQRGAAQYTRQGSSDHLLTVKEGQASLLVNLQDYLDTGLFLDHRPLRFRLAEEARGQDFLNLFCYTGSATVHAALAGARSTTSVDLSNTYLDWLRKNLARNGLAETRHRLIRDDVRAWLEQGGDDFDVILLDPPSFSNSKRLDDAFDLQRDHPDLIRASMRRLRPHGVMYFSSNKRRFQLDPAMPDEFCCKDVTAQTLDPDFRRGRKPHVCFRFSHRAVKRK